LIGSPVRETDLPHVFVGSSAIDDICTVDTDNFESAQRAVDHLAELGHTRIAYFGSGDYSTANQQRRAGFLAAVTRLGLSECASMVYSGLTYQSGAYQEAARILREPIRRVVSTKNLTLGSWLSHLRILP